MLGISAACGDDDNTSATKTPGGSASATASGSPSSEVGPGVSATEITLGMTNDLAGVGKTPYGVVTPAMQAYYTKVNEENGGVCGRKIKLLAEDDQYSPPLALEKTKKLVEQDKVLAINGALGTAAHLGVVDYLNDPNADGNTSDGVPDLLVSTGYSGWGNVQKWPWTIAYIPDYASDAKIQAKYINDNFPGKKVGLLYQNDAFGKNYQGALKPALTDPNLLVSEQPYESSAVDVSSQVLNLKDAGAEVVFLATTPGFAALAIVAAHTRDYKPQFLMSYVNSPTNVADKVGQSSSADQRLVDGFKELAGTVLTNYLLSAIEDVDTPAMKEHKRIMQTYNGPSLSTLTVYAQALAETTVKVLSLACNNLNRKGLLQAAESVKGFAPSVIAPGITIDLGPNDHYAIQALQPVQIQADGTLKELGAPITAP